MAWSKSKRICLVVAAILIATGAAILLIRAGDPLAAKVHVILVQEMLPGANKWNAGMDDLWALGPEIIPRLAAETRVRDTIWSKSYDKLWRRLPPTIHKQLPEPVNRSELRQAAMHAIAEFGPLAVRRAAPAVIAGLSETDDRYNNYTARCMRWLLPDSAPALAAFKAGLAGANSNLSPPHVFLGQIANDAIWSRIPGIFPLLTNYLGDAGQAYLDAIALGHLGSNAAPAVPALVQTLDLGAAGPFRDAEAARMHSAEVYSIPMGLHMATLRANDKEINHNRAMAAMALGRIGIANDDVRAALARAWNAPDPWVRKNAAEAVALLGPAMTNELPPLLSGLPDKDNGALDKKLLAIGKIGPAAAAALDALRDLSMTNRLRALVSDPEYKIVGGSVEDLSVSAKMAICRIDPEEGRVFLPEIADKIGYWWDPVACLMELRSLSNEVVRAAEPLLEQSGSVRQSIAAYVILSHDPNHAKALEVLRHNKSTGELNDRLLAGRLLFESVGETNSLCALLAEGFASQQSFIGQSAGNLADKMSDAARPALPAIKAALWHKDQFVRNWAGTLILKLAPEDVPINVGK